jgi:hypothetical protein
MKSTVSPDDIAKIVQTDHYDPFKVLGAHLLEVKGKKGISIRAFLPDAESAEVVELRDGAETAIHKMTLVAEGEIL